jgi:ABC-type transporter Mla subunit MlaD
MKLIDDYVGRILGAQVERVVDQRIDAKLGEIHNLVNTTMEAVRKQTNGMQALVNEALDAVGRQTVAVDGVRSTLDALIGSIRNHTDALGHVADGLKGLTRRVEAIENLDMGVKTPPAVSTGGAGAAVTTSQATGR